MTVCTVQNCSEGCVRQLKLVPELRLFNVFRYTNLHLLIITYFVIGDRRFDGKSKSKSKSQRSPSLYYVYIILY